MWFLFLLGASKCAGDKDKWWRADNRHSMESDYVPGKLALGSHVTHWMCCRPGNVSGEQHSLRGGGGWQGNVNELGDRRLNSFRPCDHPGTRHLSLLFKA